jgi:hypothetical protein
LATGVEPSHPNLSQGDMLTTNNTGFFFLFLYSEQRRLKNKRRYIIMELKRMHSICAIIVICAIIATVQAASAAPTISVEPSYMEVSQGDAFTVNITIDPDGTEVMGAQYTLYFDNVLLKALNQDKGPFLRQDGENTNVFKNEIYNTIGEIKYGETRTGTTVGVTTPGILSTIEFEVIRCLGVGELRLGNVKLSDPVSGSISPEVNNATIDIAQSQSLTPFLVQGYVSYDDGSDCNDPTVNITNLNLSKEWAAEKDASSNYYQLMLSSCADVIADEVLRFYVTSPDRSQSNITEHTVTQVEMDAGGFAYNITLEYRPGDVNGDGRITPADAVIALQMAVCGEYDSLADVDYDYSVKSLDSLMILQAEDRNITFCR